MVLCNSGIGQREKTMKTPSAEGGQSQVNASCFTRPCCAGSMHIIHRDVQELNAATPTVWKISPLHRSFPMSNQRNKYLHNVLVQVNEMRPKRQNDQCLFPAMTMDILLFNTAYMKHVF